MSRGRSAPILRPAFVMSTRAFDPPEGRAASRTFTLNFRLGALVLALLAPPPFFGPFYRLGLVLLR